MRSLCLAFLLTVAGLLAGAKAASPTTFAELLKDRPKPDPAKLAERARPDRQGGDDHESFLDLLKLREVKDPAAGPALVEILRAHADSTSIHRFAAAQALFCLGTDEAHAALKEHLLTERYPAALSAMYVRHWEMPDAEASAFLERYHLVTVGKGLTLDLKATPEAGRRVRFEVKATNASDRAFEVNETALHLDRTLYWRSADGRWVMPKETGIREDGLHARWIVLRPGESHGVEFVMTFEPPAKDGGGVDVRGTALAVPLPKPGRYTVRGMLDARPVDAEVQRRRGLALPWVGRAVTNDAEVEVRPHWR